MSPAYLLIAGIYYVLIAFLSFFSVFGVYVLIRYGKSVPFALTLGILYAVFFLKILSTSLQTLHGLSL